MSTSRLKAYLDDHDIRYVTIKHSRAYTSQATAAAAHIPGRELAKTVIVKRDGIKVMVVLPANYQIDFDRLCDVFGSPNVELATEDEFKDLFPQCDTGAMSPLGNLYGMDVFVDESLTKDLLIAFNADSHTELIEMRYEDYERLVNPIVLQFSQLEHA